MEQRGGESWPRPGTPPAGGSRDAGRVRCAAPAPAAAAVMPILVKAAADAGTRHRPSSLPTRRSAEAFASGSRRAFASVSPAPRRCHPKLWPAPPGLRARDEPGKEREAQRPRAPTTRPAICSLELPRLNREAKVRSLLNWKQLCPPGRRLPVLGSPAAGNPALSSLAAPSRGSLSLEAALHPGSGRRGHTDPRMSTAATRVWQRQRPRALGPHRVPVPALCCPQALGELGFSPPREAHRAPGPRTHYGSSSPPVGPPGPTRRQRAAGLTGSRALAWRCECEVGQGAHCTPVVAREPRIKTS